MAPTKSSVVVIQDWTAISQTTNAALVASTEYDCSANYETILGIQAFLDTTTAHTGTEFLVQYSNAATDNENWVSMNPFVALVATAETFSPTTQANSGQNNIIATTLPSGFTNLDVGAKLIGIKNTVAIANSEIGTLKEYTLNTNIKLVSNLTNTQQTSAVVSNTAISRPYSVPFGAKRCRVIVNNEYHSAGSTLMFRLIASVVTAV